jgi:hypothetical protein
VIFGFRVCKRLSKLQFEAFDAKSRVKIHYRREEIMEWYADRSRSPLTSE